MRDSFKRPEKRPLVMRDAKQGCSCVEPGKIGPASFPNAGPVFRVRNRYMMSFRECILHIKIMEQLFMGFGKRCSSLRVPAWFEISLCQVISW